MAHASSMERDEGSCVWRAPSNIALVKYWGKRKEQLPRNPSLSFTLDAAATTTRLTYRKKELAEDAISFDILLDRLPQEHFRPKITTFLKRALPYLPFIREFHFTVETSNSFPHSSGIASSASGMAALALCLADMEREWTTGYREEDFNKKASFLARLGSGSACRSIEGPLVLWGKIPGMQGSSDLYGMRYPLEMHTAFEGYRDTILLVDKGKKKVSSTLGHGLMEGHPFAAARFTQASKHLEAIGPVLESGDLEAFTEIVEREALSLHAMMMTSQPYFLLMKPNTIQIIELVWEFRRSEKIPLCFTLDAGANVHLLYPEHFSDRVNAFIQGYLVEYCEEGQYICDQIGFGAKKM